MRHVAKRLDEEKERVDFYLSHTSWENLAACVDRCFIGDYVETILSKGLFACSFCVSLEGKFLFVGIERLLDEKQTEDLRLLYRLFGRVKNARQSLRTSFVAYIKKIGRTMILNPDGEKTLVADLMKLKATLDSTINVCFEGNERYIQGERDAFTYFVNVRANKPAELIGKC